MHKSSLIISTLLSCSLSLPAFATETSNTIASVNEVDITHQDYSGYAGAGVPLDPNIINNMINRELVVQKAYKDGLDDDPIFVNKLANLKYNALFDFALQKYLHSQPISDERLRKEYDNFKPLKQYKIHEIFIPGQIFIPNPMGMPDQNQAIENAKKIVQEVTEKLKTSGNFTEIATQCASHVQAHCFSSDLGWLTQENMLPEVAKAVVDLKKDNFTAQAIKSNQGWRFIFLEDSDELPVIPFDQARKQLMAIVHEKMVAEYYQALVKDAKIEIKKQ